MSSSQPPQKNVFDDVDRYNSGSRFNKANDDRIEEISDDARTKLIELYKTNPIRAKYLNRLATTTGTGLKLGGQSTKKMNKNKKKYKLRRRHSKKNRKSMKQRK